MSRVIYSRWRPADGGFDYFEARDSLNINDDLPNPELVPASKIGVPSIEAGRPVPDGAWYVGSGDMAVGIIAPVDPARIVRRKRSLGQTEAGLFYESPWFYVGGAAAVAFIVYMTRRR